MKLKKGRFMLSGSTVFLRLVVLGMGLVAALLCGFVLPAVHREWNIEFPDMTYLRYPVLLGLSVSAIAFFTALSQTIKLLGYIDKNQVFSTLSTGSLKKIKYSAVIIGSIFALFMPVIYLIAEEDDAPGLIIFGMFFSGVPIVIAVFAAVMQRLLQNAIDIKSENELTV